MEKWLEISHVKCEEGVQAKAIHDSGQGIRDM
jgi:hypothetical protein